MKKLLTLLLCATAVFAQSGGQAVGIAIQNPSFLSGLVGWQCTYACLATQADNNGNALSAPAVLVGYGGSLSQVLSVTPRSLQLGPNGYVDGVYTLQFDARSGFVSYPGYAIAEIDFGTQELCEGTGWPVRNFERVTVTCHAHAYIIVDKSLPDGGPVQSDSPLVIKLTANWGAGNGGWPVLARNFTLTFTPTP